eukprot:scaffold654482_cov73-Prasinocladus_malaysianus.AAC.1
MPPSAAHPVVKRLSNTPKHEVVPVKPGGLKREVFSQGAGHTQKAVLKVLPVSEDAVAPLDFRWSEDGPCR